MSAATFAEAEVPREVTFASPRLADVPPDVDEDELAEAAVRCIETGEPVIVGRLGLMPDLDVIEELAQGGRLLPHTARIVFHDGDLEGRSVLVFLAAP